MGLVTTWLSGIGLDHAVENFKAAGIVTPAALAELEVTHFEALGVKEPNERRKLFYLIQRIKMSVEAEGDGEESQQQVDAVLSKTLGAKGTSSADDSIKGQPKERRETGHDRHPIKKSHARSIEMAKENDKIRLGRSTAPPPEATGRPPSQKKSSVKLAHNANGIEKNDDRDINVESFEKYDDVDSEWEEDGDSSVIADDEASLRGGWRRGSRRSQDQRLRQDAEGSMADTESIQTDLRDTKKGDPTRRIPVRRSNVVPGKLPVESQTTKRLAAGRPRRNLSLSDADDEASISSSGISAHSTNKVDVPAPRRRFESKLQNPNTRTGKALSSIPSGNIAPMSPLVELPFSKLDADITSQQKVDQKKKTSSISVSGTSKRLSYGGASSDTESDRRRRPRDSSTSGSDTDRQSGHRRIGRQSIGTSKPARLSTGSVGVKSATTRTSLGGKPLNSSRDVSGHFVADNNESTRKSLPFGGKAGDNGPMFVHGTAEDTSWGTQVARLREDNQSEHELFYTDALDDGWDDEEMRIRVLIRKRPKSSSESPDVDIIQPLDYHGYGRVLVYQPKTRVDLTKQVDTFPFAFDNVFGETSTNTEIYNRAVKNLIPGVFEGRWASCFAYGQTGSGKTFTMMGCNVTGINAGTTIVDEDNLGLYYMAALDVFDLANKPENSFLSVGVSLFEIYGGKLFDLINGRTQIKCLEDSRGKVCFPGLSEHPVRSANELMKVIEQGAKNRSTGTTSKNADSSRSHAVLQLSLRKTVGKRPNIEHGRLTFIDLAGSERGADTAKASRATRLEGAEINTSLLALKEVIRALATGDSMAHIPFRGSKLTQVLKESFTGKNSRSVMVACIAPNMSNCEHTLNTLRYADRVKGRNCDTGALPTSVAGGKGQQLKRTSRPSLISNDLMEKGPQKARESKPEIDEDNLTLEDFEDEELCEQGEYHFTSDDRSGCLSDDGANDLLDELLTESLASPPAKATSKDTSAAEALIDTHRAVMTNMLGMVKNEMVLVNNADSDRNAIDDYLHELEQIQEKQVFMITTLHEKLLEYQGYRGATSGTNSGDRVKAKALDILSDDESFEDLRD